MTWLLGLKKQCFHKSGFWRDLDLRQRARDNNKIGKDKFRFRMSQQCHPGYDLIAVTVMEFLSCDRCAKAVMMRP